MEHHDLDVWPIPKDKKPQYINEPWLIDSINIQLAIICCLIYTNLRTNIINHVGVIYT